MKQPTSAGAGDGALFKNKGSPLRSRSSEFLNSVIDTESLLGALPLKSGSGNDGEGRDAGIARSSDGRTEGGHGLRDGLVALLGERSEASEVGVFDLIAAAIK